jgi:hypothetical protein
VPAVPGRGSALSVAFAHDDRIGDITDWMRQARRSRCARQKGWNALEGGLLRSYRRGRQAFVHARASGEIEDLNAWRKRVKESGTTSDCSDQLAVRPPVVT